MSLSPYPLLKCLYILTLLINISMSQFSQQQEYTFEKFEKQFNRSYKGEQRQKHKQAFQQNYQKFLTYRKSYPAIGVNHLMDLTKQQFQNLFTLKDIPQGHIVSNQNKKVKSFRLEYPQSLDYRNFGIISPVKSQGSCGSCWAFTAAAVYEANLMLQTGVQYDLSEQFLLECDKQQFGCAGGIVIKSLNFINKNGAPREEIYPYKNAKSGYEKLNGSCQKLQKNIKLPSQAYYISYAQQISDDEIIYQLITHGPLAAGIIGNHPSFLYASLSGFIEDCSQVQNLYFICHAVVLIGYTPTHWIIKNSWDKYWGDQGYGYVNRSSNCGLKKLLTLFRTSMYGSMYPEYKLNLLILMYAQNNKGWGEWTLAIRQKGQIISYITLKQAEKGNITIPVHSHSTAEIIVFNGDEKINSSQISFRVLYSTTFNLIYSRQIGKELKVGQILSFFCPSICRQVVQKNNRISGTDLTNIISNISNLEFIFIMGSCGLFVISLSVVLILFFCCSDQTRYIQFTINNNSKTPKLHSNCMDTEKAFQKESYNQNQ